MTKVNLDALIPREDFRIVETSTAPYSSLTGQINNIEPGAFFAAVLRKPDFQRETSEWDHIKICDFIESFLNGDLIPALILWNSGNRIFVIDGAHRLSALIAWVNDDYGDGDISRAFFEYVIPDDQIKAAEQTRRLIAKKIGSYKDHKFAVSNPNKVKPELLDQARRLGSLAWQNQWVQGDADKAEASFFKINQQAAPINKTEFRLLQARKKPNALAARAIIRAGTGHKYWSDFSQENQDVIEKVAKEINDILFDPSLKTPIKTLDLPIAGSAYSSKTLPTILDVVNLVNEIRVDEDLQDDNDGEGTIKFLKNTRKIIYRISGLHPSSLGFHPAIYFYSSTGRFQPTSLLAVLSMVQEFQKKQFYNNFIKNRREFEDFLLRHKNLQNQMAVKYGAGLNRRGYVFLRDFYLLILEALGQGKTDKELLELIKLEQEFAFLKLADEMEDHRSTRDFTSETKSAAFLREALKTPLRCQICKGLIHYSSITADHIQRKQDGGFGIITNAQIAHPYCNTTFKN